MRSIGTKGAIRFDQEDQNALWLYRAEGPEAERGFRKILTGPAHPDYLPSARARATAPAIRTRSSSRRAISCRRSQTGQPVWPTFRDGLEVSADHRRGAVSASEKRPLARRLTVETVKATP